MTDDAASILAPPDPTWNPTNGGDIPPNIAAPSNAPAPAANVPSAPPEYTDSITRRGANDDPTQATATPFMLTQGGRSDVGVPGNESLQPPTTPTSQDVHQHMSWIGRTLDKVATALGGGETLKVTKLPDGTTTMEKVPSTEGEKWGRIAAAALVGAGAGLQNSQGPNALSRAAGAGMQAGAQIPQQAREMKQQEVDSANKEMLFKANRLKLQQDTIRQTLENQRLGIQMDQDEVDRTDALNKELAASPWHDDLGLFPDMDSAIKAANADPNLVKDHVQAKHRYVPEYNKDRTVKGFHAYNEDPAYKDQLNTTPRIRHKIKYVQDDDGILQPTQQNIEVPVNGVTNGDFDNGEDKYGNDMAKAQAEYATTKKNLRDTPDKAITTSAGAYDAWRKETDPTKKDGLWKQYKQILSDEMAKRAVTHVQITPSQGTLENWGTRLSDPQSGITMANVPANMRSAVNDYMSNAGLTPAIKLGADEIKRMDLANIAVNNLQDAQEVLTRRPDLFGPKGFMKKTFKDYLEGGDPDAHKFATAITLSNLPLVGIHNVRGKYAVDDLAKEDADIYHNADAMQSILDEATRAATQISQSGGRRLPARQGAATPAAPAAAAPAAGPATPPQTPQIPDALPESAANPIKYNHQTGEAAQWQGNKWVKVKPPARR